jgi:hypothetical protein
MKNCICDTSENTFYLFEGHNDFPKSNDINLLLIIVTEHALQAQCASGINMCILWSNSFLCRHHTSEICRHTFATFSYRNITVFDRTSGTDQLHCSNKCETLCAAIAVSQTDSIALVGAVVPSILIQKNPVVISLPKALR